MARRLSVVVPFYNVEQYIATCLESLRNQTMSDLEVILVDDGSCDGSREIAESFCRRDDRFRIVQQENQGLGPARNAGVAHATGDFLAFVDSDDLVPARAYSQMLRTIDESGSDMVSGNARRFNDLGVRQSYVHEEPFAKERIGTHVREFPALALDRMAWNKVIRRSFWDRHAFAFPAIMYEDYPVTTRLHVLANRVDVLSSPVYYWRERDGGDLSITQRKWEVDNLRDRADSAAAVLDFLHSEAPEVAPAVEQHLLHIDLSAIVVGLFENDVTERERLLELADRVHGRTSSEARAALIPFERIQNDLLERRKLDELKELVEHRARRGTSAPLRKKGRFRPKYHLQLPFLDDRATGVPTELYEVDRETVVADVRLRDAVWRDGSLRLDMLAAINGMEMTSDSDVRVWLVAGEGRREERVPVPVERFRTSARPLFPDELAGARVVVDPGALVDQEAPEPAFWRLVAEVSSAGVTRTSVVRKVSSGRARLAPGLDLEGGLVAFGDLTPKGYGVRVRRTPFAATHVTAEGEDLVVRGWFRVPKFDPSPTLRLWVANGAADREFVGTAEEGAEGQHQFEVRIPGSALVAHEDAGPIEERTPWLLRLVVNGKPHSLAVRGDATLHHFTAGSRRVTADVSIHGNLILHESFAHPFVDAMQWSTDSVLRLSGRQDRCAVAPAQVLARRYVTPADRVDVPIPLTWDGDRFSGLVDLGDITARADAVTTSREGREATPWEFHMECGAGLEPIHVDTSRLQSLADPTMLDGRRVRPTIGRSARLRIYVE